VLSGKGGTGKTTVATNLAWTLGSLGATRYVDYDVEEPDGAIFLHPTVDQDVAATSRYPVVGENCVPCGRCSAACSYHALAEVGGQLLTFPELCHGCGACALACPRGAIAEAERTIGHVRSGPIADGLDWYEGVLNEGESLASTVVRRLRRLAEAAPPQGDEAAMLVADCPPGSSCEVIHAAEGSDLALLVAEPTRFGLHDLGIAVRLMRALELPMAVFVNKDDGSGLVDRYAATEGIPVIGRLPFDLAVARAVARGELIAGREPWAAVFTALAEAVLRLTRRGEAAS